MRATPLFLTFVLAVAVPARAAEIPAAIYPVRDDAGVLDRATLADIRSECELLERATGVEIGVLVVETTHGENHHDFAVRVYNAWGVGKAGVDKGVLLLVAFRDRRMEIVPGNAYRGVFDQRTSEAILETEGVPRMRAGKPAEAVHEIVLALARRIRQVEGVSPYWTGPAEQPFQAAFGGGQRSAAAPPDPIAGPQTSEPSSQGRSSSRAVSRYTYAERGFFEQVGWVLVVALVLGLAWIGFMIFALTSALRHGKLLVSRTVLNLLSWPVFIIGGGIALVLLSGHTSTEQAVVPGALAAGGLVFGNLARHLCRNCNKWMSIRTRTLVPPTYSSTGTGERTYHCSHCLYHHVETCTLPRKTRSSSSSYSGRRGGSSSSRGGSRSFGGGRSSGGGGGASW